MKPFLSFLLVLILSLNTMALPLPPGSTLETVFTGTENGRDLFTFIIPEGFELVPGALYFFDSEKSLYHGTFNKRDAQGRAVLDHFEPVENLEGDLSLNSNSVTESNLGTSIKGAHQAAIGAGVRAGMARALYRGLIDNDEHRAKLNEINRRTEADLKVRDENYQKMATGMDASQKQLQEALALLKESLKDNAFDGWNQGFSYESQDKALVADLTEIEKILRAVRVTSPRAREARAFGLQMVQNSDKASAQGEAQEAIAYRRYAESFLDLAVGIDPLTGTIRDVYEAFSGKNIITGEELDNFDRSFAIIGALTFGFGSKFSKGIKIFSRLPKAQILDQSLEAVTKIFSHMKRKVPVNDNAAHNYANYQKYLRDLRGKMERPVVSDPELKEFIQEWYWKTSSKVGNGSTAAAIRFERVTGHPVENRWHSQKGQNALKYFENWLKNNPNAVESDRRAVEHLILDLRDTFGGFYD